MGILKTIWKLLMDQKFCSVCGMNIDTMYTCPHCGIKKLCQDCLVDHGCKKEPK